MSMDLFDKRIRSYRRTGYHVEELRCLDGSSGTLTNGKRSCSESVRMIEQSRSCISHKRILLYLFSIAENQIIYYRAPRKTALFVTHHQILRSRW